MVLVLITHCGYSSCTPCLMVPWSVFYTGTWAAAEYARITAHSFPKRHLCARPLLSLYKIPEIWAIEKITGEDLFGCTALQVPGHDQTNTLFVSLWVGFTEKLMRLRWAYIWPYSSRSHANKLKISIWIWKMAHQVKTDAKPKDLFLSPWKELTSENYPLTSMHAVITHRCTCMHVYTHIHDK